MIALLASFVVAFAAALTGLVQFALRATEVKTTGPWLSVNMSTTASGVTVELRNVGSGPAVRPSLTLSPDTSGVVTSRSIDVLGAAQTASLDVPSAFDGDVDVTVDFVDQFGRFHRGERRLGRGPGSASHLVSGQDWIRTRPSGKWRARLPISWI